MTPPVVVLAPCDTCGVAEPSPYFRPPDGLIPCTACGRRHCVRCFSRHGLYCPTCSHPFCLRCAPEHAVAHQPPRTPPTRDPLEPETLEQFLGQPLAVANIRTEIAAAANGMPQHILAYGPPGVGKTTLGKLLATALRLPVELATGSEYATPERIRLTLEEFRRARHPFLWIIDEADGIGRAASQVLHSVMTHGVFYDRGREIALPPIAIYATTNFISDVPRAMRDRFPVRIRFRYYPPEVLGAIAEASARRLRLALTPDAAAFLATNVAGSPRLINHLLLRVRDRGEVTKAVAKEAMALLDLFPGGLTRLQVDILAFLARQPHGRAGLNTISAAVYEDPHDVRRDHERYLIQAEFIRITPGGRQITEKGVAYLATNLATNPLQEGGLP